MQRAKTSGFAIGLALVISATVGNAAAIAGASSGPPAPHHAMVKVLAHGQGCEGDQVLVRWRAATPDSNRPPVTGYRIVHRWDYQDIPYSETQDVGPGVGGIVMSLSFGANGFEVTSLSGTEQSTKSTTAYFDAAGVPFMMDPFWDQADDAVLGPHALTVGFAWDPFVIYASGGAPDTITMTASPGPYTLTYDVTDTKQKGEFDDLPTNTYAVSAIITNKCGSSSTSDSVSFTLGRPPTWKRQTPPLTATTTARYHYGFHASGAPVIEYQLTDGPDWLHMNGSTGTVSGLPPAGTTSFSYSVVAIDHGVGINGQPTAIYAGSFSVNVT